MTAAELMGPIQRLEREAADLRRQMDECYVLAESDLSRRRERQWRRGGKERYAVLSRRLANTLASLDAYWRRTCR